MLSSIAKALLVRRSCHKESPVASAVPVATVEHPERKRGVIVITSAKNIFILYFNCQTVANQLSRKNNE